MVMLAYTASELYSITLMQGFAGLSLFSVLLLMALGLLGRRRRGQEISLKEALRSGPLGCNLSL